MVESLLRGLMHQVCSCWASEVYTPCTETAFRGSRTAAASAWKRLDEEPAHDRVPKLESLIAARNVLKSTPSSRDTVRGERLFRETLCIRCHRFGNEGRTLGPDLTFVAS